MKTWTIDEFLAECEALRDNQYTYDYDRMPDGTCNGHEVGAYQGSWRSILIDNCVVNMWCDKVHIMNGPCLSILEYIRYRLEK